MGRKSVAKIRIRVAEKLKESSSGDILKAAERVLEEKTAKNTGHDMVQMLFNLGQPSEFYKQHVDPNAKGMSFEAFKKQGFMDYPIPPDKSIVGFKDVNIPGRLENTTGRINLYSPFWGQIRPATKETGGKWISGMRNSRACYEPNLEGYEFFFKSNDVRTTFEGYKSPVSGRTYTLQYITNKSRGRAHTVFDSNPMIKDHFLQTVKMNPADAAKRDIQNGDTVYAYNDRGCIKVSAEVSHYMVPGVISVEHGGLVSSTSHGDSNHMDE